MSVSRHGFSIRFDFPVFHTRDTFDPANTALLEAVSLYPAEADRCQRLFVAIDAGVAAACPELAGEIRAYVAAHTSRLALAADPVVVPGGEAAKNDLQHTLDMLARLNAAAMDRQSFVVAIGGGAVLDMVSFAAALCHRSVRVIRLPTTVLAQADSGVAVKNGINLFSKKNFIGTFVPPCAVINDDRFLRSLDHRDLVSGLVEGVKVSLLRDPDFFAALERDAPRLITGDLDVLPRAIWRSAELHLAHICGNGDPFELGSARPLDFGHWAAHKLEAISDYRVRHGEAVAIGMALDCRYAVRQGWLAEATADRILAVLDALGLTLWDAALDTTDAAGRHVLLAGLAEFREHLGGQLHITMLRDIGRSFEVHDMDDALVLAALGDLAARAARRQAPALHA